MKILVAILLNTALLWWLLPWLWRQWHAAPRALRYVLLPALSIRLLVGGLSSLNLSEDAYVMSQYSYSLANLFWRDPVRALHYLRIDSYNLDGFNIRYYGSENNFLITSNSVFISKTLMWLNLASLKLSWLNGLYISLLAFIGSWILVRTIARKFAAAPVMAGAIAFLFWPSVIWFGSGIRKEAFLLGSGAWLTALVLQAIPFNTKTDANSTGHWSDKVRLAAAILVLAVLHIKFRYFFAFPLIACLMALFLVQYGAYSQVVSTKKSQVVLLIGVLVAGALAAPKLSHVFTMTKFTSEFSKIYTHQLGASETKVHIEYPNLRPTGESALSHAPLAVVNALVRPWPWESRQLSYVVGSVENVALIFLVLLAVGAAIQGKAGRLPFSFVLTLLIFCLILAFLIGLSTPNIGNLHRYRSGFIPYLVFLLLQNDYVARLLTRLGLGNEVRPGKTPASGAVSLPN